MGAKFSLQDTVIAGELPLLWARLLVEIFLLLFGIKINNLQQPVACCLCSSLSLSFRWLLRSHALALLMFFALCRRLLLPCYRLPKDNNYCSCFFFIFFSVSSFSFRVCTIRGDFFFFGWTFSCCHFQVQPTFVFVVPENAVDTHTDTPYQGTLPTHTHLNPLITTLMRKPSVFTDAPHRFSAVTASSAQFPLRFPFSFPFLLSICHRIGKLIILNEFYSSI